MNALAFLPEAGDPPPTGLTPAHVGMTTVVLAATLYMQTRTGCEFTTALGEVLTAPTAVVALGKVKLAGLGAALSRHRGAIAQLIDPARTDPTPHAGDSDNDREGA